MIFKRLLILGFLGIFGGSSTAGASDLYWAAVRPRPNLIVVGTLSEVKKDAFVVPDWAAQRRPELLEIHDSGWIEVDSVLYGGVALGRLPITWYAATRFHPAVKDAGPVVSFAEESHSEGDRGIWVLWRRTRHSDEFSMYFDFYLLPLEWIEQVKKEIKQLENE
jgi:hypothetical protein